MVDEINIVNKKIENTVYDSSERNILDLKDNQLKNELEEKAN